MNLSKGIARSFGLVNLVVSAMLIASQPESYQPLVSDQQALVDIQAFSKQLATEHQFDQQQVYHRLANLKHRADIIQRISRPAESVMPWYQYRKIWLKDKRIDEGVEFWKKHQKTLQRAEREFGVDAAIIVAIIGVETFYGKIQGDFPVLEALHTLAFYYPKRSAFFRKELAEYFILARNQGWNLDEKKGSYAGAMGMGQFISSSYRQYAVDYNDDGKIDLFTDPVDMIGSVANYFKRHHWQAEGFIAKPITLLPSQLQLSQTELAQSLSLDTLKRNGIDISALQNKTETAGIYEFDQAQKLKEYWLAGKNFYVITRYNHSAMYALAVFQLSEAIREKL